MSYEDHKCRADDILSLQFPKAGEDVLINKELTQMPAIPQLYIKYAYLCAYILFTIHYQRNVNNRGHF